MHGIEDLTTVATIKYQADAICTNKFYLAIVGLLKRLSVKNIIGEAMVVSDA